MKAAGLKSRLGKEIIRLLSLAVYSLELASWPEYNTVPAGAICCAAVLGIHKTPFFLTMDSKTAESSYLNPSALAQGLTHLVEYHVHCIPEIFVGIIREVGLESSKYICF